MAASRKHTDRPFTHDPLHAFGRQATLEIQRIKST